MNQSTKEIGQPEQEPTNEQKAELLPSAQVSANAVLGAVYSEQQIAQWKNKAQKWDALEAKIAKFYLDENGNELDEERGDLADIGEIAAMAFKFL